MKHGIVDIETLDVKPESVILSIGFVTFDFDDRIDFDSLIDSGFYVKLDVKKQIKSGRSFSKDTIDWWKSQGDSAKSVLAPSENDVELGDALDELSAFVSDSEYDFKNSFIFSRGSNFDFPIIESAYRQMSLTCPFNTWKIRCLKTMFDALTGSTNGQYYGFDEPDNFIKHNSLHDAALDACKTIHMFNHLLEE